MLHLFLTLLPIDNVAATLGRPWLHLTFLPLLISQFAKDYQPSYRARGERYASVSRALTSSARPNPLPPLSPSYPIGPDNYPIPGTDVKLVVQRPYGETLPENPTILCLVSAQADLDRRETARGDVQMPKEWEFEERGIKIVILSPFRDGMRLSVASTALQGLVTLMTQYLQFGTRAGTTSVSEDGNVLGAVELSRSEAHDVGVSVLALNSTNPGNRPANFTRYANTLFS